MSTTYQVLLYSGVAGLAIPFGALLGRPDWFRSKFLASELRHGVLAFGAGALLSAVALVLVPSGIESLSLPTMTIAFFGGGLVFAWLDWVLSRHNTPLSQLVAMLTDFLPECLALGALFVQDNAGARLLAILIAVQNVPEAFSAFRDVTGPDGATPKRAFIVFALLAPVGPIMAYVGLSYLSDNSELISMLMTFAAGGILYLMFQEIAPNIVLKNTWLPPMGALLGFFVGVLGSALVA